MVSLDSAKTVAGPLDAVVKAYDAFRRWPIIPVAVILILLLSAIFAPIVAPYDPLDGNLRARNVPPVWIEEGSSEYLLGTDHIGRDILSRTIHGGRVSFQVAAAVLLAGAGVGTVVGLASGYLGGVVDEVFMRLADFAFAMPFIVMALVSSVVWGPSLWLVIILLSIFTWAPFARQVRAEALQLKETDYVALARWPEPQDSGSPSGISCPACFRPCWYSHPYRLGS